MRIHQGITLELVFAAKAQPWKALLGILWGAAGCSKASGISSRRAKVKQQLFSEEHAVHILVSSFLEIHMGS